MKRNRPPDDEEERQAEVKQIRDRLDQLFAYCSPDERQIALCNHAIWIPDKRHARVEQAVRITPSDMVNYSSKDGYHYLGPYETLYCLDSNQLLIFYNNLPLSLVEAYQIIIENKQQYREYRVLQQLTRTGHICFEHTKCIPKLDKKQDPEVFISSALASTSGKEAEHLSSVEKLHSADSIESPHGDLLKRLQELGPKTTGEPPLSSSACDEDVLGITFDVYKRESFAKHRPQQNRPGKPDYYVIVRDLTSQAPPNADELVGLSSRLNNFASNNKLLFALIDDDNSIFFAQYLKLESLSPTNLYRDAHSMT